MKMPTLTTTSIPVSDLVCVGCAEHLQQHISALAGVESAQVSLPGRRLDVTFNPDQLDEATLRAAVPEAGYRCADEAESRTIGQLEHQLEMQPITFCTTTDRMQYELPHTSVPHEHRDPGAELRPEWAALLMSVSSIIVATNAVLLKRVERDLPQRDGPE